MMKSEEVEAALLDYIGRASVFETLCAQYFIFCDARQKPPQLIEVNQMLRPALVREMARKTNSSIDAIFELRLVIETALVQFTALPNETYCILHAPGCKPLVL